MASPLPQPGPAAKAVLDARIPEFGSARNPVDITAQVLNDPESLRACADALCADPAYGAIVCRTAMPTTSPRRASPCSENSRRSMARQLPWSG